MTVETKGPPMSQSKFSRWPSRISFLPAILAGFFLCGQPAFAEKDLAAQLLVKAPQIVDKMFNSGHRTIGVLTFRVRRTDGRLSDRVGTFNQFVAERLEAALNIAIPKMRKRVMLIADASTTASQIPGASHLSAEGRAKLFSKPYPTAWGRPEHSEVDAFVTGDVDVDYTHGRLTCDLFEIAKQSDPKKIARFQFAATKQIISELGVSLYQTRGGPDAPNPPMAAAAKPLVRLGVLYDGQPVRSQEIITGGVAEYLLQEPREGQTVELELQRMDKLNVTLGAVLKVNGENTLYRERKPDADCAKWILKPGDTVIKVVGYQFPGDEKNAEPFRVASLEESREKEVYYGDDVGLISLTVFREEPAAAPAAQPQLKDFADRMRMREERAVDRADLITERPATAEERASRLINNSEKMVSRGAILPGSGKIEQRIRLVEKKWEQEPVGSWVMRYYRPSAAN